MANKKIIYIDVSDGSQVPIDAIEYATGKWALAVYDESGGGSSANHNNVLTVVQAVTVTASAYSSGNVLGTKQTIAGADAGGGYGGLIQSIIINSKAAQTVPIDIILFKSDPASSTFTDKAALSINAADFDKILAVVHVTDWTNLGTPGVAQALNLAIPYGPGAGASLYAVAVVRGAVTPVSTSDFSFAYRLLQNN